MIGATIRPMPHVAIASCCSSGGKVSIRMACEDGIIAAPAAPWIRRKDDHLIERLRRAASAEATTKTRDRNQEVALAAKARRRSIRSSES